MTKFLSLVVLMGLAFAGWANREKLGGLMAQVGRSAAESSLATSDLPAATPQRATPSATPHPAREAQAQATALYPGLALPNSALNKKFVALYKESQSTDPALLSRPDWPLQLADRAVVALGGAPMPRTAPAAQSPRPPARSAKQVVLYTVPHCPSCAQAKKYLAEKGVPYREIDIDASQAGRKEFRRLGGTGTPLIMVGSTKLDGFDEAELERVL